METHTGAKPILIIDNETALLTLLEKFLSKNGYCVDTAENGQMGIRKMEHTDYSLVLTDIKMPDMSGDRIFDHMRNKIKKTTPVVAMSGTPELLVQSDFNAVLTKPYPMKELLNVIRQLTLES